MISPTCGSWIGARTCRMTRHGWVVTGRPAACCGAAARVGAAVEAPARGALVDLPRSLGDRLAQPVGVAAGVLHLVGERGPVDAAVGHPAGRQPGPAAASELGRRLATVGRVARAPAARSTSSSSCSSWPARAAAIACSIASASDCATGRFAESGPSPSSGSASPPPSPDRPGSPAPPALGGGSGSPTIRRYSRAASSSRSSSPSGIQTTLA